MTAPRVLLILFDGAEWKLIHPLLRANRLPHLAAFMRAGSYGPLRSLEDTALASPILWTSFASGKLPHKHGIKDFYDTAAMVRCARLWEIFEHENLPVGLFRYLVTWPPRPTRGFIVPDWCARTPEAYPTELSFINTLSRAKGWQDLARNGTRAMRHGMRVRTAFRATAEAVWERLTRPERLDLYARQRVLELDIHVDLFVRLMKTHQPHFAAFYTGLPDATQHQYWKFMEPEKFPGVSPAEVGRYGRTIEDTYEALDRQLGRLLRVAGSETLVVIGSDHGAQASTEVYRWAQLRQDEFIKTLGATGMLSAFRIGARTYFRRRNRPGPSLADLAERARAMTLSPSSSPVFQVDITGEDEMGVEVVYLKQSLDDARLRSWDGTEYPCNQLLNLTPTISGSHSMHGVLLLRGPHVPENREIAGASLLDVTPTILALLGRPVGEDMDGRVLTDAIEPEYLGRQPVRSIESYDTLLGRSPTPASEDTEVGLEEVKERLRDLGYIE